PSPSPSSPTSLHDALPIYLTVSVGLLSGVGPLSLEICPFDAPSGQCRSNYIAGAGGVITIDKNDVPPLTGGEYVVRVCNLGTKEDRKSTRLNSSHGSTSYA